MDVSELIAERRAAWCQDGVNRIESPEFAKPFIDRVGIATHYAACSEVPSLFEAYMSQPTPKVDNSWDSPAGHVYEWRWSLGRAEAAYYGVLVAKKPTWISWNALPFVLGFAMERREPEKLYSEGSLSNEAIRIVRAFEGTHGTLSTREIRRRAGFPTGKEQRAAYLKGIEELDSGLMLAKVFSNEGDGDDMSHALVRVKYASVVESANGIAPAQALAAFLGDFIQNSKIVDGKVFSKRLRIPQSLMSEAVAILLADRRIVESGAFLVCR